MRHLHDPYDKRNAETTISVKRVVSWRYKADNANIRNMHVRMEKCYGCRDSVEIDRAEVVHQLIILGGRH